MTKKKLKNLSVIQRWMDSKNGQMLLNYAYSWGASVVILGTLFKLTHISGADIMLFIGMGTEVIVFFLSGFERPWEKDEVEKEEIQQAQQPVVVGGNGLGGGTIIIGGGAVGTPSSVPVNAAVSAETVNNVAETIASQTSQVSEVNVVPPVANIPQYAGMTPEMAEATQAYVEQLKSLTETLQQVAEQSARLTRDSEEMENMNRTLTGINRFYEMQLRSVSVQSNTIDDVNAQTIKMAEQLEELNAVYARMVEALKVNMK